MTTLAAERTRTAATAALGHPAWRSTGLTGMGTLLRFLARRDRIRGLIWFVALVGTVVASAVSIVALYETPAQLADYAQVAQIDEAIKVIAGPGYGLDDPTQGAVVMNETEIYTLIAVALMAIFMITRHTRAEEETDRAEMVGAAPIGRLVPLLAACVWVSAISIAISAAITIGMLACGLPTAGSVAFGATTATFGLVFVGIAAVTAQVASSARAANAGAGAVLGIFFVLRGVGDIGNGWMSWLSPLGIAQAIRAYADERWWVLGILLALAALFGGVALRLSARRDLGAGILPQRPGPPEAHPSLSSPLAMAIRLQRVALIGWAVGIGLLGFFVGMIADEVDALAENDAVATMLEQAGAGSLTDSYLAITMLMCALTAAGFTISSVLRLRSEEVAFRASPVLATPVSRTRWMMSHTIVAVVGSIAVMLVAGVLTGGGYALQTGDAGEILPVVAAGLIQVPPMLVLGGIAAALFGFLPRWSYVAWAPLAVAAVVGFLAETLDLPTWVRNLSPFEHVPALPAASFELAPPLVLTTIAVAATIVGLVGFNRRAVA